MFSKRIVMTALAASIAGLPATRVAADFADGLVGGIVGGAVSGIIVNESAKARERKRATTQRTYRKPANTAARQQVREEQTALNYFGFAAGTPDGVRGRNTRNAVSQYQAHLGYPVTGYLADYERQFLVGSYYRAQSGGAATAQLIAQRGQGPRGLLLAYRDEAAGAPHTYAAAPAQGMAPPVNAFQATQPSFGAPSTTSGTTEVSAAGATGLAALPNLLGSGASGPSLASHCNQVSLITSSNGGFVTQANMSDPQLALDEQFCLARTYAIAEGETLASGINGVTPAQLEEQCNAVAPAMRDYVSSLSLLGRDEVVRNVRDFALKSGQSPAQLVGTAKICLSVGYRTDRMNVALGSAVLLTAMGEEAYGELIGHHLNEGIGVARRPDLALPWYSAAVESVEKGAKPVFAPGNSSRTGLIRKAALSGTGMPATGGETVQPASGALPSFSVD